MRLGGVVLFVSDLPRMARFYAEVLGLKAIAPATEQWIEFDAGGSRLGLHAIPAEYACEAGGAVREEAAVRLDFTVADVAAERARLEALGVPILVRPWADVHGVDPEGNVFGLMAAR